MFLSAGARADPVRRKERSRPEATTEPADKITLPCRPGLTLLRDVGRAGDEPIGGSAGDEGINPLLEQVDRLLVGRPRPRRRADAGSIL